MSDAIVLPLNTTHYSFELENYLDKYVVLLPLPTLNRTANRRVESTALSLSLDVDLSTLRKSIHLLQAKSLKLDREKRKAERKLKKLIKKWKCRHARRTRFRRHAMKMVCKAARFLGISLPKCSCHDQLPSLNMVGGTVITTGVGRLTGWH